MFTTATPSTAIPTNATTTASSSPSHSISSIMPLSSSSSTSSFLIPQSEWNILNMIYNNNMDNNTVMNYTNTDTNITNTDTDNMIDVTQLSLHEIIIYLNNISITLLGTFNNYIAAIQTMKDTLSLLHNTTATASCSNNNNQNHCIYEVYTRTIHTAAQRIIYEIQKHQQQHQQQQQLDATTSSSSSSSSSSSYYTTAMNINEPKMNHIGVVVMSCYYSPNDAYYLLASIRTSKVAIYIDTANTTTNNNKNNNNDYYHTNLHVIRSILVYNYGIAHRCCTTVPTTTTTTTIVNNNNHTNNIDQFVPPDNTKIGTFCLQIFQYAEQLLLPVIQQINEHDNQMEHDQVSSEQSVTSSSESSSELLLLYRFILTRNLMMISCKLGMSLCELYKETLDPIETSIVHSNTTTNTNTNDDIQLGLVQQQQQESTTPANTLQHQQPQQQQPNYHPLSNTLNNNDNNNVMIRQNVTNIRSSSSNIQQQQDDYASAA